MSDADITQVILARAVGVTQGSVSGWLNGAVPKMDKLTKIAEVLKVEPDVLLFPHLRQAAENVAHLPIGPEKQQAFERELGRDTVVTESATAYVTGARARLKAARIEKGLSPSQMAKKMGYSETSTYQNIEDGRSQMGEKMIRKAAKILGLDESELMSGSEHPIDRSPSGGTFGAVPDVRLPPGMTAKFVPLLSLAECGPAMTWTDDAYAGEGALVFDCKDPKAFAVKLSGDSMQPKYDAGDTAVIYPSHSPRNGDVVLARLDDEHGGDVMIKLYQSSADKVTLSSYNHHVYQPMTYPRSSFALIYPVAQITKNLR